MKTPEVLIQLSENRGETYSWEFYRFVEEYQSGIEVLLTISINFDFIDQKYSKNRPDIHSQALSKDERFVNVTITGYFTPTCLSFLHSKVSSRGPYHILFSSHHHRHYKLILLVS